MSPAVLTPTEPAEVDPAYTAGGATDAELAAAVAAEAAARDVAIAAAAASLTAAIALKQDASAAATDAELAAAIAAHAAGDASDAELAAAVASLGGLISAKQDAATAATDAELAAGLATAVPKSLVDAKGDIPVGTANDTLARLPVGANGRRLVPDSSQATGLAWETPYSVRAHRTADQSIPNAGIGANLAFTAEKYDNGGFHDTVTNNDQFVIPVDGLYLINAKAVWASSNVEKRYLILNADTPADPSVAVDYDIHPPPTAAQNYFQRLSSLLFLPAATVVSVTAYQASGSAQNVVYLPDYSPVVSIARLAVL